MSTTGVNLAPKVEAGGGGGEHDEVLLLQAPSPLVNICFQFDLLNNLCQNLLAYFAEFSFRGIY